MLAEEFHRETDLEELYKIRPPYLSTLIHELYRNKQTGKYSVVVWYNGKAQGVCDTKDSNDIMCPLDDWANLVHRLTPSKKDCETLYSAYEFLEPPYKPPPGILQGPKTAVSVVVAVILCTSALTGSSCSILKSLSERRE